jgi:hypothetical protein
LTASLRGQRGAGEIHPPDGSEPGSANSAGSSDDEDANRRHAERWIVVIDTDAAAGRRRAQRFTLGLHFDLAAGRLTCASDRAISDTLVDLRHEQHRRAGTLGQVIRGEVEL